MEKYCEPFEEVSGMFVVTVWNTIVFYRNGVVKYESVMKLRDHLDQLGKMQGITQDEKGKI